MFHFLCVSVVYFVSFFAVRWTESDRSPRVAPRDLVMACVRSMVRLSVERACNAQISKDPPRDFPGLRSNGMIQGDLGMRLRNGAFIHANEQSLSFLLQGAYPVHSYETKGYGSSAVCLTEVLSPILLNACCQVGPNALLPYSLTDVPRAWRETCCSTSCSISLKARLPLISSEAKAVASQLPNAPSLSRRL